MGDGTLPCFRHLQTTQKNILQPIGKNRTVNYYCYFVHAFLTDSFQFELLQNINIPLIRKTSCPCFGDHLTNVTIATVRNHGCTVLFFSHGIITLVNHARNEPTFHVIIDFNFTHAFFSIRRVLFFFFKPYVIANGFKKTDFPPSITIESWHFWGICIKV